MKPEKCPKCGNMRFSYNPTYQSYMCPSCKYEDRNRLTPSEFSEYNKFKKFMKLFSKEEGDLNKTSSFTSSEVSTVKEFSYDDFKKYMNRYIQEEVRPAQEAKKKLQSQPKKKRGRKKKNAES